MTASECKKGFISSKEPGIEAKKQSKSDKLEMKDFKRSYATRNCFAFGSYKTFKGRSKKTAHFSR